MSPATAALFPLGFGGLLMAFLLLPPIGGEPGTAAGFVAAGTALMLGAAWMAVRGRQKGRGFGLQVVLRKHHWVQAAAQLTLLTYWGLHVRSILAYMPFIVAQLLFAYGLDALINWSRRGGWQFGVGPVPIVLSINFFLWFKPEWFYWQFVIVALGFAAKEFIQWEKDGRRVHIFNPSSFPLAVFSLVLLLTGTTGTTFGPEIAATLFNPPHMYLVIFLVALPAQLIFGVATMTLASVVTAYAWGLLYYTVSGTYFFHDAFVPIAVFLGMHLLFTDPSTSPRTEAGRVVFGVLYAAATIALFWVLEAAGAPRFYDKLLPIPILNLMIQRIDRVAAPAVDRLGRLLAPPWTLVGARYRFAVVAVWALAFTGMSATGGVGDDHPGQYLPFWQQACESGNGRACEQLTRMQETYCLQGSGWACNELAVREAGVSPRSATNALWRRACQLDFGPGCTNLDRGRRGDTALARGGPELEDLPILLRGSKGPIRGRTPQALYALGCSRGWSQMCGQRSGEAREAGYENLTDP